MSQGYEWKPIEDLPDDWRELASSEMAGLFAAWKDQVVQLKDSPAYQEFQVRLRREWAIETGIIEGLYDIDRGVTRTLIERGLHASLIAHGDANKPAEEIIPMLKDHEMVVEGLFDFIGQKRSLSTSYIKQVHQALTTHQETAKGIDSLGRTIQIPLLRGEWKKRPNNPTRPDGKVHEYCPPEQVASEMDRLIEMHQRHLQEEAPPEVEAAWLHHRFVQIHPFQDGNGRVARALASLVLIRAWWFPLVIHRDERSEYIDCLEQADAGDLSSLVQLFVRVQKRAFNQATSLSKSALLSPDSIEQVIDKGLEKLKQRDVILQQLRDRAVRLQEMAREKLQSVASSLTIQLKSLNPRYAATVVSLDSLPEESTMRPGTLEIADRFGYRADPDSYAHCIFLAIIEKQGSQITFSFHAASDLTPRLLAVSAWFSTGDAPYTFIPVCRDIFQCAIQEEEDSIVSRFRDWLDETLLIGLEQWRRQI
jgi:Fic family protein